jgi:hypothetical protein
MESSDIIADSGSSIIDPDGPAEAPAKTEPEVIASVMSSVIATSPDEIGADLEVGWVSVVVVPAAQAVSGIVMSASSVSRRRIRRP